MNARLCVDYTKRSDNERFHLCDGRRRCGCTSPLHIYGNIGRMGAGVCTIAYESITPCVRLMLSDLCSGNSLPESECVN